MSGVALSIKHAQQADGEIKLIVASHLGKGFDIGLLILGGKKRLGVVSRRELIK